MRLSGFATANLESREPNYNAAVRLGIIGLGNIGRQHLQVAKTCSALQVVAVADSHLNDKDLRLQQIAVYRNWEELLVHPDVEAVSICVPHHLHSPMTMASLQAGKHVLVEKPLALDCAHGRALISAAKERRLVLMVEMTHRFYPPLGEARRMVQEGHIGRLYAVEDRIVEPVTGQFGPWMQRRSQAGGGVALTNGVHMLDRIAAVTGQSLAFQSGRAGFNAGLGDVEDTAAMLLTLADGVPVQLLASWPRGAAYGNSACDDELTLYGTAATLRVWAWRGWRLEPLDGRTPAQEKLHYKPETDIVSRVQVGVRGALGEFAAAVRQGREPRPPAQVALDAQALIEEFYTCVNIDGALSVETCR